ncbi:MAG: hypothetical protein FWF46_00735 [Oscillospiraceae bacterium]|nr:hypothetical protein [Oscillospiraceae bacterium]
MEYEELKAEYEKTSILLNLEVNKLLFKEFPEFYKQVEDDCNIDLAYVMAGEFTRFLLEKYKKNDLDTVRRGFDFIEQLHLNKEHKIRELATIGYLESMLGTDLSRSDNFLNFLGVESKKWWDKLNKFWNGDIMALRDDN